MHVMLIVLTLLTPGVPYKWTAKHPDHESCVRQAVEVMKHDKQVINLMCEYHPEP